MGRQVDLNKNNACTLIETTNGAIKLIRRSNDVYPALITCSFSSLADCLNYVHKNQFRINIIHSGKRNTREDSGSSKGGQTAKVKNVGGLEL